MTSRSTAADSFEHLSADPAPSPDKPDAPVVSGPRPRVVSSVILKFDGSNYIAWKTIMPTVLDGEPFAWEVTPPICEKEPTNETKKK